MSVQDDKSADQDDDQRQDQTDRDDDQRQDQADQDDEQRLTEKPEPDEDDKKEAAKMMEAYVDKPTIVLPGTGGSVSGTAVNDWLDEDGNPKHEEPEGGGSEADASDAQAKGDDAQAKGDDAQAKGDDGQATGDDAQAKGDDAHEKGDGERDEEALKEQIEKDKALNEKLREAASEENKGEKG